MLNLVLPLCLKIGCGNKDDPKLRKTDIQFTLNLLLNMINPNKKVNRGTGAGGVASSNGSSLSTNAAAAGGSGFPGTGGSGIASNRSSSVQYNPAGDSRNRIKTSSLEIAFLGTVFFKSLRPATTFVCSNTFFNPLKK